MITALEDYTIFEKPTMITSASATNNSNSAKPKVKTVPLYRSKRSSAPRMSTGSCHIAIEEISGGKGKDFGNQSHLIGLISVKYETFSL